MSGLTVGLAVVRRGGAGRKQKAIIRRESTMAAGQTGKVPGAPPRNPTEAHSREARKRRKIEKVPLSTTASAEEATETLQ